MTTFVLVHGAWHGAWCWDRVRGLLERRGHAVLTPTLTGLGERAHLLTPQVGLPTHIDDVCAVLRHEQVRNAVLVGHSYGGIIIAGALARLRGMPQAVRQAIYLDAVMVGHGQCWADTHTPQQREARLASGLAQGQGGALVLPPPPPEALGITAAADIAWAGARLTPHPARTYLDILDAPSLHQEAVARVYVDCTAPPLATLAGSKRLVRTSPSWEVRTLEAGHDCMVSAADATAGLLLRYA